VTYESDVLQSGFSWPPPVAALISSCRRRLPDPVPEGTGGTGGLDLVKGEAIGLGDGHRCGAQGGRWPRHRDPCCREMVVSWMGISRS
jgi:hypothetical protein